MEYEVIGSILRKSSQEQGKVNLEQRELTNGAGGKLAGSVSWGIVAHVSTQWPFRMPGEVTTCTALEVVMSDAQNTVVAIARMECIIFDS